MGIGINFVCSCCGYDSGILMLNQGTKESLQQIVLTYIHTYTQEIDLVMHPHREQQYRNILSKVMQTEKETIHHYDGCVCYGCNKTYEILDILQRKEEEVFAGEFVGNRIKERPIQQMFQYSNDQWRSLLGEQPLCLFCNDPVNKITEEALSNGLMCPKCKIGKLAVGEEFEIWG